MVDQEQHLSQSGNADGLFLGLEAFTEYDDTRDLRPPIEIINSGDVMSRTERVPIESVISETPIIDPEHAASLGMLMKTGRGQLIPILVRAREEEGNVVYDIADGFHRTAGKKAIGDSDIVARVLYGCSDEELLDLRIVSANSVKSVKFARIALWMNQRYELTGWSEKMSLIEAVRCALFDSDIDETVMVREEGQKMKEWFRAKSVDWQTTMQELWVNLSIIEQSDPMLVQMVRPDDDQDKEGRSIRQMHLRIVSEAFPFEQNYGAQRALINWVIENKPTGQELEGLIDKVKGRIKVNMPASLVNIIIQSAVDIRSESPSVAKSKAGRIMRREPVLYRPEAPALEQRQQAIREHSRESTEEEVGRLKWWEGNNRLSGREAEVCKMLFDQMMHPKDVSEHFKMDLVQLSDMVMIILMKRNG